jgi:DNA-binding MarR family transcriptional regulator
MNHWSYRVHRWVRAMTSDGPVRLTRTQGQLVAYVYWYTKVHRIPPSENEVAEFLGVRGPSAHRMIVRLHGSGFLSRTPGRPRTLKVLLSRDRLPELG